MPFNIEAWNWEEDILFVRVYRVRRDHKHERLEVEQSSLMITYDIIDLSGLTSLLCQVST